MRDPSSPPLTPPGSLRDEMAPSLARLCGIWARGKGRSRKGRLVRVQEGLRGDADEQFGLSVWGLWLIKR